MSPRIFRQPPLLLRRLGHVRLQPRNHVSFERGDQPGVHFLVHVQEGLAVHGVDPVIGRGPQTQPLAGHIVARQRGLVSVIHAHVAVAVEIEVRGVLAGNPFLGQGGVPFHRPAHVLAQHFQLRAQRTHFGDAIQPQQFAPFARCLVPQLFQRPDARQRHQPQQQEDALDAVKSVGQFVELRRITQQSRRQQGRQCQQYSALRYVAGGVKLDRRRLQFSHRRRDAFQRTRRAVAHRRLAVGLAAFALVGYFSCVAIAFF